jgi:Lrp/AsnC family leucine-responsive transcriptional regulator
MKAAFDEKDLKIINLLQQDCRLSVKDIGEKIGLSFSPTYERLKRIEKEKIIERHVALINRHKVDIGILAYCNITLKEQSKKTILGFEKEVIKHDEIIEVISISGTYDFMLKIYAKDIDDYNRFVVNVIADMPNIGQYHSLFVLNEVKKSTAYILK